MQLILSLVILLGVSITAQAAPQEKKVFLLKDCDCVGVYEKDYTFLSSIIGDVSVEAEGNSLKQAEKKAKRQCFENFKALSGKVKKNEVSHSGCEVMQKYAGLTDWEVL